LAGTIFALGYSRTYLASRFPGFNGKEDGPDFAPSMVVLVKPASNTLITLLGSSQDLKVAELVTMTLADGTIFNWTTAPVDISFNGTVFGARGPLLQIKGLQWKLGVETDVLKLQLWASATNAAQLIEQSAVMQAVQQGLTDNALIVVQRLFTATWGDWSAGAVTLFRGNVSDTICDMAHAEFDVKSRKELFNVPFPYLTFQPGCQWPLYGAGCTLNPATFAVAGTVASGSVALLLNTNLTNPDQYFNEGYLTFTSGLNIGITRTVRQYLNASGQTLFYIPFPNAPSIGDTFNIYPGCDKTYSTCLNKFNNLINFKGMPFIPIPETAVAILLTVGLTLHWTVWPIWSYIKL
jgi:uncharacterized phage protein (TIGR02218 family)